MSWYDSKRHTKSHTDMYYLQEHDTRWGHENELCRISVIEVEETSNEYDSAVNNDKVATEEEEEEEEEEDICMYKGTIASRSQLKFLYKDELND